MFLAVDADYRGDRACVAGVTWSKWSDEDPLQLFVSFVDNVAAYEPGSFYRRELPCLLALLDEHRLTPDCIVVDGHVFLDGVTTPGLGKRLFDALHGSCAVVGVAKEAFRETPPSCAIRRGGSSRPLYITATGMTLEDAKQSILQMHGPHRIPTLIRRVDQLCRGWESVIG